VYDLPLTVEACLRAGTRVDVAWVVEASGFSHREWGEGLAITPGGGRVGSVLSGSLNDQLADLATRGASGRLVSLEVTEVDALVSGLSCGGKAQCLIVPATDLPDELWQLLRARQPICLVSELSGDRVTNTRLYTESTIGDAGDAAVALFSRRVSDTSVSEDRAVTVLWPIPSMLIVGTGGIADALVAMADLLGWRARVVDEVSAANGIVARLASIDKLVVLSHDDDVAGPVLEAALAGPVGYIGALGSRRTQQSRADWLAYRGITDLSRIHGPAGLDIGARSAAEIAVSIVAQAVALASIAT
jgi:xanthine dehydrogenase accessory factor